MDATSSGGRLRIAPTSSSTKPPRSSSAPPHPAVVVERERGVALLAGDAERDHAALGEGHHGVVGNAARSGRRERFGHREKLGSIAHNVNSWPRVEWPPLRPRTLLARAGAHLFAARGVLPHLAGAAARSSSHGEGAERAAPQPGGFRGRDRRGHGGGRRWRGRRGGRAPGDGTSTNGGRAGAMGARSGAGAGGPPCQDTRRKPVGQASLGSKPGWS